MRSAKLDPCIRNWWGEIFISLSAKDWFEHKRYNLMWDPPPDAAETTLEILLESRIHLTYKSHVIVVSWIIIFSWRNKMGEEVDFLFTVTVGMPCWGLGEHEHLIIVLFLPIFSRSNCKGTWTIRGSDWGRGVVIPFGFECKR